MFARFVCAWLGVVGTGAWANGIPFRTEAAEGPSNGQWGWAIAACVVVLAVLVLLARQGGVRRLLGATPLATRSGEANLRVMESVRLTPQVRLVTVEFGAQVLLLAVSSQTATVVATKDAAKP